MQEWKTLKTIESLDGGRNIELTVDHTGNLYRYYVNEWKVPAEEDRVFYGEGYWTCTSMSGYFETLTECETDARASVSWLEKTAANRSD